MICLIAVEEVHLFHLRKRDPSQDSAVSEGAGGTDDRERERVDGGGRGRTEREATALSRASVLRLMSATQPPPGEVS